MEAIDRLLAFEDLRNLKARYLQYLDSKQWDKYANLFVEDAVITDARFSLLDLSGMAASKTRAALLNS